MPGVHRPVSFALAAGVIESMVATHLIPSNLSRRFSRGFTARAPGADDPPHDRGLAAPAAREEAAL